jgi:formylglycine-generating enzyme required for sulfatase activity
MIAGIAIEHIVSIGRWTPMWTTVRDWARNAVQAGSRRFFMRSRSIAFGSVFAMIVAATAAPTDDPSGWLKLRQIEFAKWMVRHPAVSPRLAEVSGSRIEIWDAPTAPKMILVHAGNFSMGSPVSEQGRNSNETQHPVTIRHDFAVGKYAVTRAEFAAFVDATGFMSNDADGCFVYDGKDWNKSLSASWRQPGFEQFDNDPVVCVSWNDAQAYSAWLSQETGHHYRLLSESEYEFAARAGTTTAYWWGDQVDTGRANCGDCGSKWDKKSTSPVGSFQANPFGLYDMNGDVWQWLNDCWNDNYRGAPTDGSAWATGNCERRVQRGGGWSNNSKYSRAALRSWDGAGIRYADNGFRLARIL